MLYETWGVEGGGSQTPTLLEAWQPTRDTGSQDSLDTVESTSEFMNPDFIGEHEPAMNLHLTSADTETTDLDDIRSDSPLLMHPLDENKPQWMTTTRDQGSSSDVSLYCENNGINWFGSTLNRTLQLPLKMFLRIRSTGGHNDLSIPRRCFECKNCDIKRCGNCRFCFEPSLHGPCLRKPPCLAWRGEGLKNWNNQHLKLIQKYPLDRIYRAIVPSPKSTNNTGPQLENSFVSKQQDILQQSNTIENNKLDGTKNHSNIVHESIEDSTTTNNDMDCLQKFIDTKIQLINSKTTKIYRMLDELHSNNKTFLTDTLVDQNALKEMRLETNTCRTLHESIAVPKLLEIKKQLMAIEFNCYSMKKDLDNQRKLEERLTGALHKVILGLDPHKTLQSNTKSMSETCARKPTITTTLSYNNKSIGKV